MDFYFKSLIILFIMMFKNFLSIGIFLVSCRSKAEIEKIANNSSNNNNISDKAIVDKYNSGNKKENKAFKLQSKRSKLQRNKQTNTFFNNKISKKKDGGAEGILNSSVLSKEESENRAAWQESSEAMDNIAEAVNEHDELFCIASLFKIKKKHF